MTARYAFPLAGMQAHVQGNFTYQSAIWPNLLTDERTVLGQQSAYGIANFSFGLARDTYALELLVKNVFDRRGSQFRYAECTELTCGPIAVYDSVTQPRLIGLQFSQRFGSGR